MAMETAEGEGSGPPRYFLSPARVSGEDILFCVDVDAESLVEMKSTGTNGRPLSRLDGIKQAILLFIHSKLSINPDHRFAFATLSKSASWLRKEFSSDVDHAMSALRSLTASSPSGYADLTHLLRLAAHEAKKSRTQGRILRVILFYCRSSIKPQYQWTAAQKLFTLDVMYLHDKPGPDNCPQEVYDTLVEALETVSEHEGYILESGQGLTRVLFRQVCVLLAHPQQRTSQDFIDFPKSLVKKSPQSEPAPGVPDDSVPSSTQRTE